MGVSEIDFYTRGNRHVVVGAMVEDFGIHAAQGIVDLGAPQGGEISLKSGLW